MMDNTPERNEKKVLCIETGEIFNSLKEAAKAKKTCEGYLRSVCDFKTKIAAGCHWTYNLEITEEQEKKILCIETGEIFNSLKDAARAKKTSESYLRGVCDLKTRITGGCHWTYNLEITEEERQEIISSPKRKSKKVLCIETGEVFNSLAAAAKAKKTYEISLRRACDFKTKTAAGCHWTYNWKLTEEQRQEIMESVPQGRGKKVLCIETGEIFDSLKKAAKAKKTYVDTIKKVCELRAKTTGGYHWTYDLEITEEQRQEIMDNAPRQKIIDNASREGKIDNAQKAKKIMCIETGEIFRSIREAAKAKKTYDGSLRNVCDFKTRTAGGYHWTSNTSLSEEQLQEIIDSIPKTKKVICIETGEIFSSVKEAVKVKKIHESNLREACILKEKTVGGYHWTYDLEITEEQRQKIMISNEIMIKNAQKRKRKKVLCVETGEIFNSLREAAKAKKINESNLSGVCDFKTRTAGGYHWTYNWKLTEEQRQEIISAPKKKKEKILRIETNHVHI